MDPRREFVEIISGELGACPERDRVLDIPSLEHGWVHGLPVAPGNPMVRMDDDLSWWFVAAFAPDDFPLARRIFNSVPAFFFDLAKLAGGAANLDWNLIYHLRRRLLREMWPTAYSVATRATGDSQAARAAAMIRGMMTEAQWRKNF